MRRKVWFLLIVCIIGLFMLTGCYGGKKYTIGLEGEFVVNSKVKIVTHLWDGFDCMSTIELSNNTCGAYIYKEDGIDYLIATQPGDVTINAMHVYNGTVEKTSRTVSFVILNKKISNIDELKEISEYGNYIVTNNIDCSGSTLNTILNNFYGVIDGNNHTISNITLDDNFRGLFNNLYGSINNLNLFNVNIENSKEFNSSISVICNNNYGKINNVAVHNYNINCPLYSDVAIYAINNQSNGVITNCKSIGKINGNNNLNGFILNNFGNIKNCYYKTTINGIKQEGEW